MSHFAALAILIPLLVPSGAGAAAHAPDYEICHRNHAGKECYQFEKSCAGGLIHVVHGKKKACRALAPTQCKALVRMTEITFERVRALPAGERTVDTPSGMSCGGYLLALPGHLAYACQGRDRRAVTDIFELMKAIDPGCS